MLWLNPVCLAVVFFGAKLEAGDYAKAERLLSVSALSSDQSRAEMRAVVEIIADRWDGWMEDSAAAMDKSCWQVQATPGTFLTVHPQVPEVCIFMEGHSQVLGIGSFKRVLKSIAYMAEEEVAVSFPVSGSATAHFLTTDEESVLIAVQGCEGVVQMRFFSWLQGEEGSCLPVLVTDYYNGGTMAEFFVAGGTASYDEGVSVCCDILRALQEIQSRGVVHNDFGCRNIMFQRDMATGKLSGAVLIDFGLAKRAEEHPADFLKDTLAAYSTLYIWSFRCEGMEACREFFLRLILEAASVADAIDQFSLFQSH